MDENEQSIIGSTILGYMMGSIATAILVWTKSFIGGLICFAILIFTLYMATKATKN